MKKVNSHDLNKFQKLLVENNRGRHIYLIRFQRISGLDENSLLTMVKEKLEGSVPLMVAGSFEVQSSPCLLVGLVCDPENVPDNIDGLMGVMHDRCLADSICNFDFGIARTQCNWISDPDEIFAELMQASLRNLNDNLVRWSWTYFNRANAYFSDFSKEAVIQPTVCYNPREKTISVKGGEVFVGGETYPSYYELIEHIPDNIDRNRAEILILEKLILSSKGAKGLLKFNLSPQSLIEGFNHRRKVKRVVELLEIADLSPANVRMELVEKPYNEVETSLREVCSYFFNEGITFAADDFGVKSQSHQVVLDLGEMIKEFKLDPISFKFKPEQDQTKFLDNLAFIDYCKRLADNREAVITAEAVDDLDTLFFLMEHHIYNFQTFLFSQKMHILKYNELFDHMQNVPFDKVERILRDEKLAAEVVKQGSVFEVLLNE